jgi:phage terminase large subunit-like protein
LRLVDVAGGPAIGDVSRPWLMDFAAQVFGSYDAAAGRRLDPIFLPAHQQEEREVDAAAGIMLTALLRNWRKSGEYYILAPTKEVADNSYFPRATWSTRTKNCKRSCDVRTISAPSHIETRELF